MKKTPLRIALIEPSQIIREGLTNIIMKSGSHYFVYYIENLESLYDSLLKDKFDIIILNPSLTQANLKFFDKAKREAGKSVWIGLVYSFFEKELLSNFNQIIQISDNAQTVKEILDKADLSDQQPISFSQKDQLSEREIDVLKLLVNGLSNKEIADKLNISIHTVISHRKNISNKTNIKSQSGLTIYAISNKIIHLEIQ